MTPQIGRHELFEVLSTLGPHPTRKGSSKALEEIIILRGQYQDFGTYGNLIERGQSLPAHVLAEREDILQPDDVCNLQFTSGSTGNPKAAMLTHQYVPPTCDKYIHLTQPEQQPSQQLALHRRPHGLQPLRHPLLPTTTLPLLRPSPWHASGRHPRLEDHFPRRDVRPEGGIARDFRREVHRAARRADDVRGDP